MTTRPSSDHEQAAASLKCSCQPIHSQECVFRDARSSQYRNFYAEELGRASAPQQATSEDSWSKLERHTKALAKAQPQAVSAGALSAPEMFADEISQRNGILARSAESRVMETAARIREHDAKALAAHDQKVRAETLQEAIGLARLMPFRAHAADDIEFHSGCEQTRERIVDALRKLAAPDLALLVDRDIFLQRGELVLRTLHSPLAEVP